MMLDSSDSPLLKVPEWWALEEFQKVEGGCRRRTGSKIPSGKDQRRL